ncbi:MAG: TatD family deoxyribonuclease [Acidobacteria bacterium]|nr:TatD family deoxyribonuclease [Acidobacteriota bacterium]
MIDSHCHLADEQFAADLGAVIERARTAGVDGALCILDALNDDEARRADGVAAAWPNAAFAIGVHPHQAGAVEDAAGGLEGVASFVRRLLDARAGACAVGEIGLDYHYDFAPPRTQIDVFRRQIALARDLTLPIVVHTREADADTVDAIRAEGGGDVQGVFHCFTGDAAFARRALDLGFHVSFSGIVTFRNATAIREAAAIVPAERLLAETDAPYLSPVPYRGRRNEPARVAQVIDTLSEVRGEDRADIVEATRRSYHGLFGAPAD